MNELILKEMNSERIVYFYKPDGKGAPGEIIYDLGVGEVSVASRAAGDENGRYAHKAGRRVCTYIEEKNLPMRDIQAWY